MTEEENTGRSVGASMTAALPRVLAAVLGPVLRMRRPADREFLDRRGRDTHTESMLALPESHWEDLARSLGIVDREAVLDVGCGSGAWLPALGRLNSRVVGVDPDGGSVEIARRASEGSDNVEVRLMHAEKLELEDESFDTLVCMTALPYLGQPEAPQEMARVLKANGRLVLGTVGTGYYAKHVVEGIRADDRDSIRYGIDPMLVAAARTVAGEKLAQGALKSWSPRSVRRMLRKHGLKVERVVRSVEPVDASWPTSYLGRPVYFIAIASK
jgi:ubiquinone/menaquinone biosynthesis C-methylase UbiE